MSRQRQSWDDDKRAYVEFEVPPITPEQARAASLTICEIANDVTVARHVMDVLGLLP